MEKRHIVKFLKEKKRGIYDIIVSAYANAIAGVGATMGLAIIKEDLERETGEKVVLNYFSLAQAIQKYRKSNVIPTAQSKKKQWEFRDSNELKQTEERPGTFRLNE